MNAPRPPGGEKPAVDIRLSVQRSPRDHPRLALAQRVEALGFDALLVGDPRGSGASPWLALANAAAVTERIRLGTYVLQAGVREPLDMANDAATLDLLDPGRVVLGMGAGHTPVEWGAIGRRRPAPAKRIARLEEVVDAVAQLLAGETLTLKRSMPSWSDTSGGGASPASSSARTR